MLNKFKKLITQNDLKTTLIILIRKLNGLFYKYYLLGLLKFRNLKLVIELIISDKVFSKEKSFTSLAIELLNSKSPRLLYWKGIIALHHADYETAKNVFREYSTLSNVPKILKKKNTDLIDNNSVMAGGDFKVPHSNPQARICVYTIVTGNDSVLEAPLNPSHGVELICFSDRERALPGWKVIVLEGLKLEKSFKTKVKILPYEFLTTYDYSLFLSNHYIAVNHLEKVLNTLLPHNVLFLRDRVLNSAFAEIESLLTLPHEHSTMLVDQYKELKKLKIDESTSIETDLIWRSHNDTMVLVLMQKWWKEFSDSSLKNEKISLLKITSGTNVNDLIANSSLEYALKNVNMLKLDTPTTINKVPTKTISKVVFIYDPINAQRGASVLRCHQLSQLIQGNEALLEVEKSSDLSSIKNSIIIIDKYRALLLNQNSMQEIKNRNNILIADPVDDEIFYEKFMHFDGLIASSIKQYVYFKQHFPHIHTGYVLHHADSRLSDVPAPQDYFRPSYLGEPKNMYQFPQINNQLEIITTDTTIQKLDWLSRMNEFNFHYAVRSKLGDHNVFKPFTKGVIAAHCGANIMVHEADGDALLYLGTDYPFLMKGDLTDAKVLEMFEFAKESFNGPVWNTGLEMMVDLKHKTSHLKMRQDFWNFIKIYLRRTLR